MDPQIQRIRTLVHRWCLQVKDIVVSLSESLKRALSGENIGSYCARVFTSLKTFAEYSRRVHKLWLCARLRHLLRCESHISIFFELLTAASTFNSLVFCSCSCITVPEQRSYATAPNISLLPRSALDPESHSLHCEQLLQVSFRS